MPACRREGKARSDRSDEATTTTTSLPTCPMRDHTSVCKKRALMGCFQNSLMGTDIGCEGESQRKKEDANIFPREKDFS